MDSDLRAQNVFGVQGTIALVTGGGTGIGLMIAKGLAANGAKVYIGSRRKNVIEAAVADHASDAGELVSLELDVTNKESIKAAVAAIESAEGRLDILVNNAGQVGPRSAFVSEPDAPENASAAALGNALFEAESFEGWSDLFTINISSAFFVSMAFLGLLEKGSKSAGPNVKGHSACIINVGSISGVMKLCQNHFAYNTSKAAIHHLTKMMATELALKGHAIRVNGIAPGVFPSEMAGSGLQHIDDEIDQVSMGMVPLPTRRAGRATDMAAAVLYLASAGGFYVNGQIVVVDGGFVAVNPSVV